MKNKPNPTAQANDVLPFKHGEEGTHHACQEIIEKYGDQAWCCDCNGHKCKPTPPPSEQGTRVMHGKDSHPLNAPCDFCDSLKKGFRSYKETMELVKKQAQAAEEQNWKKKPCFVCNKIHNNIKFCSYKCYWDFERGKPTKHGMSSRTFKAKFYRCWENIRLRTGQKGNKGYKNYGGRGIKVLWNSFEEFKNDMYDSYLKHVKEFGEENTSIERIDVNGHYCKDNCTWATWLEQSMNTRKRNVMGLTRRDFDLAISHQRQKLVQEVREKITKTFGNIKRFNKFEDGPNYFSGWDNALDLVKSDLDEALKELEKLEENINLLEVTK